MTETSAGSLCMCMQLFVVHIVPERKKAIYLHSNILYYKNSMYCWEASSKTCIVL